MEEKNNKIKPPILVIALGIMWILSGISAFIKVLLYFFKPIDEGVLKLTPYGPAIGILFIYIGFGILKLKNWARLAVLSIAGLAICVLTYFLLFKGFPRDTISFFIFVFFLGVILYYFTRSKVKKLFN